MHVIEGGPEELRTQGAFYYYKDVAWFEEEERKKKEVCTIIYPLLLLDHVFLVAKIRS